MATNVRWSTAQTAPSSVSADVAVFTVLVAVSRSWVKNAPETKLALDSRPRSISARTDARSRSRGRRAHSSPPLHGLRCEE
eukprot:7785375-Pyramimonas_sp.AAC.1